MKRKLLAAFVLLMLCAAAGMTEVNTYTYGGSGREWLHDIAAAPDGRIAVTGYTDSSDGSLSDRTKTWRAGWVMMLNAQMNVMWNYCSRSGDADHIKLPVFHEDGTLTVVHETEGKQMKIVRLDREGNEIESRTVLSDPKEGEMFWTAGATQNGYVLTESRDYGAKERHTLFDWDGNAIAVGGYLGGVYDVGAEHSIHWNGESYSLYALDDTGAETELAEIYEANGGGETRSYNGVISLSDGGAAAYGAYWGGTPAAPKDRRGLISRWDAQGNLVFEMLIAMTSDMTEMVETKDGFAALCYSQEDLGQPAKWSLMYFDEMGIRIGEYDLGETELAAAAMAQREDGALVIAQMDGKSGYEDVRVTVVEE